MKISQRETALLFATLAAMVIALTLLAARRRVDEWKELRLRQEDIRRQIRQDKQLVDQRDRWAAELSELSRLLPVYPADRNVDVLWMSKMDQLAAKHGLRISKRQPLQEKREGDIYELPIEVPHEGWEGTLDALVHFLFDLQSEGAMLDIRQLVIKPEAEDRLKGRFVLYCAYTRAPGGP
jgi:Tfp pilus assembly protein PilO